MKNEDHGWAAYASFFFGVGSFIFFFFNEWGAACALAFGSLWFLFVIVALGIIVAIKGIKK